MPVDKGVASSACLCRVFWLQQSFLSGLRIGHLPLLGKVRLPALTKRWEIFEFLHCVRHRTLLIYSLHHEGIMKENQKLYITISNMLQR